MDGPLSITTLELKAYCELKGIWREDDVDMLMRVIPILDDEWVNDWHRRAESRREAEKRKRH